MTILVTVSRKKINDKIFETFIISPQHHFLLDWHRAPYKFLKSLIVKESIANKYQLLDIKWSNYSIVFIMKFSNRKIDFKMSDLFKFKYNPILGKKTCFKCKALKIFNNQMYCRTKSKKIHKNSWYKCKEWQENIAIEKI